MEQGTDGLTISDAIGSLSTNVIIDRGDITITVRRGKAIQHILYNLADRFAKDKLVARVEYNLVALLRPTKKGTLHPLSQSDVRILLTTFGEHPDPVIEKVKINLADRFEKLITDMIADSNPEQPKSEEQGIGTTKEQQLEAQLNERSRRIVQIAAGEKFEKRAIRRTTIAVAKLFSMNKSGLLLDPALNEAINAILDVTAGKFHRSIGREAVLHYLKGLKPSERRKCIESFTRRTREKLDLGALNLEDNPLIIPMPTLSSDILAKMSTIAYQVMKTHDSSLKDTQIEYALEQVAAQCGQLATLLYIAEYKIGLQEEIFDTDRVADMKKDPRGDFVEMVLRNTGILNNRTGELSGRNLYKAMKALFNDYGDDLPQIFFDLKSELATRLNLNRVELEELEDE
jgi:hypothetical protein